MRINKTETKTTSPTTDSTADYLEKMNSTLKDLAPAKSSADSVVMASSKEMNTWKNRFEKARSMEKLAETPEGVKTMSILANQAQTYHEACVVDYDAKKAHSDEIDASIAKLNQVINELESLAQIAHLETNIAKLNMPISSDGTQATYKVDVPSFDSTKVDRLVFEAQALIVLKNN